MYSPRPLFEQQMSPEAKFESRFNALVSADRNEDRSSQDTKHFLGECDELVTLARELDDPDKVREALKFTLRVAWNDTSYETVVQKASELIQDAGSTRVRAIGLQYRFMANRRLGMQAHGQKRTNLLTTAMLDCGDLIIALRSIEDEAGSGQFDEAEFFEQDYREIEELLSKKSVWQRIGQLATKANS